MRDLFTIGSPIRLEKVKPVLMDDHLDTFMSMNETKFARWYFLDEMDGKELKDNWWWAFLSSAAPLPEKAQKYADWNGLGLSVPRRSFSWNGLHGPQKEVNETM